MRHCGRQFAARLCVYECCATSALTVAPRDNRLSVHALNIGDGVDATEQGVALRDKRSGSVLDDIGRLFAVVGLSAHCQVERDGRVHAIWLEAKGQVNVGLCGSQFTHLQVLRSRAEAFAEAAGGGIAIKRQRWASIGNLRQSTGGGGQQRNDHCGMTHLGFHLVPFDLVEWLSLVSQIEVWRVAPGCKKYKSYMFLLKKNYSNVIILIF